MSQLRLNKTLTLFFKNFFVLTTGLLHANFSWADVNSNISRVSSALENLRQELPEKEKEHSSCLADSQKILEEKNALSAQYTEIFNLFKEIPKGAVFHESYLIESPLADARILPPLKAPYDRPEQWEKALRFHIMKGNGVQNHLVHAYQTLASIQKNGKTPSGLESLAAKELITQYALLAFLPLNFFEKKPDLIKTDSSIEELSQEEIINHEITNFFEQFRHEVLDTSGKIRTQSLDGKVMNFDTLSEIFHKYLPFGFFNSSTEIKADSEITESTKKNVEAFFRAMEQINTLNLAAGEANSKSIGAYAHLHWNSLGALHHAWIEVAQNYEKTNQHCKVLLAEVDNIKENIAKKNQELLVLQEEQKTEKMRLTQEKESKEEERRHAIANLLRGREVLVPSEDETMASAGEEKTDQHEKQPSADKKASPTPAKTPKKKGNWIDDFHKSYQDFLNWWNGVKAQTSMTMMDAWLKWVAFKNHITEKKDFLLESHTHLVEQQERTKQARWKQQDYTLLDRIELYMLDRETKRKATEYYFQYIDPTYLEEFPDENSQEKEPMRHPELEPGPVWGPKF